MSTETTVTGVVPYGNYAWEIQTKTPQGDTRAIIVRGASWSEVERMAAALANRSLGFSFPLAAAPSPGALAGFLEYASVACEGDFEDPFDVKPDEEPDDPAGHDTRPAWKQAKDAKAKARRKTR